MAPLDLSKPVKLVDLCANLHTPLKALIQMGATIELYAWADTDPRVIKWTPGELAKLSEENPTQFPRSAWDNAASESFPQDVLELTPGHWQRLGKITLICSGPECPPRSDALGRPLRMQDPRAASMVAVIANILHVHQQQRSSSNPAGVCWVIENVKGALNTPELIYMAGIPAAENAIRVGSGASRPTVFWSNCIPSLEAMRLFKQFHIQCRGTAYLLWRSSLRPQGSRINTLH